MLSGGGGSGVGDIIEFASGIFAYNWRAHTRAKPLPNQRPDDGLTPALTPSLPDPEGA